MIFTFSKSSLYRIADGLTKIANLHTQPTLEKREMKGKIYNSHFYLHIIYKMFKILYTKCSLKTM